MGILPSIFKARSQQMTGICNQDRVESGSGGIRIGWNQDRVESESGGIRIGWNQDRVESELGE